MPLSAGEKLGPYDILALLGTGGMGEVWKARDTRLDRFVAIKQLKSEHNTRFEREARAIAALNHPNICQIFDVGPDYLVLEYIEGEPWRGPMAPAEFIRLALQAVSALDEAHTNGILHRDLKPANILVTRSGLIKLVDFGLAKRLDQLSNDATKTLEGTLVGTLCYMSPEQAAGEPADERSDIFSLGTVAYEVLSGKRAFPGDSAAEVLNAVLHKEPPEFEAPAEFQRLIRRCLAKQPRNRFAGMRELREALEKLNARAEPAVSIAVLPFVNMSDDHEQQFFSDGLTDEIINALTQIPGLKVIARTSSFAFRGKDADVRGIANALGVTTILEGSVRRSGNRVRITAQLVTAVDGSHLWSQRYDREMKDVFAVQDAVAAEIAGMLQIKLATPLTPAHPQPPKLPAYEAYLKARFQQWKLTPESLEAAKRYYERAIELDPEFALAYAGRADCFIVQVSVSGRGIDLMPRAREAARKALELDPSLPEASALLGTVAAAYDYDWEEGKRRLDVALHRPAVPPLVYRQYAFYYLLPMGRCEEAAQEYRRAVEQDPLNVQFRFGVCVCLVAAGRFAESESELRQILEIDPANSMALSQLALLSRHRGNLEEALAYAQRSYDASPWRPGSMGVYAGILRQTGLAPQAENLLRQLHAKPEFEEAYGLLTYHQACGEGSEVTRQFHRLIDHRHSLVGPLLRLIQALYPDWPMLELANRLRLPVSPAQAGRVSQPRATI